jgi:hypothetical protein
LTHDSSGVRLHVGAFFVLNLELGSLGQLARDLDLSDNISAGNDVDLLLLSYLNDFKAFVSTSDTGKTMLHKFKIRLVFLVDLGYLRLGEV